MGLSGELDLLTPNFILILFKALAQDCSLEEVDF